MNYQDEKREKNRRNAERFRNSEKGKAYIAKWREENREKYNQYHKEYYHRKKQSNTADANDK